jgi:hypothetical protein
VSTSVDPITVSVIQHRLLAIVEEMGEAMLRTSYSQILNSSRDFSTGICDLDGRLIAQAEHVPIHVGALPWAARSVRDFFKGEIRPGDVYLLNDPYHGGNHLPDLTAFVPVFDGDKPVYWSINRAHQSDIGGATHGAYNAAATEIWQEGIRITPLRLYEKGELKRDVMEMLVTNVRHPRDFRGDLAAMIGSARVGERRLLALAAEFGWPTTYAGIEAVLDGAERQTRAVIAGWKDGVYKGEAILDDDGHKYEDIPIRATVTKRGSDLKIDLSDSHEQVIGFVNSSYPNMRSAVAVALLPDRSPHAQERRHLPAARGDRQARHDRVGERGRAGDARHQPLRPGDHRGDHPCGGTRLPRPRHGRLGPALPDRDPGPRSPAQPALHLAPLPGPARRRCIARGRRLARRRRVAGRGRHQVRQPRGDGGALPAVLPPTRIPP